MKVLKQKRDGYKVSLSIEVSIEEVQAAVEPAYKRISKHAKVQGFRPGKVPRDVFEKHYGKEYLMQEAVNDAVNKAYQDAISELDLKIVDYPKDVSIDPYEEGKPSKFTLTVDVEPELKLGKYKGLKVKVEKKEVTDDLIEEELNKTKEDYAEYSEKETPCEDKDIIRFNIKASIDGTEFEQWTRDNAGVRVGLKYYGEDFDQNLIGMKKGDQKQFSVTYPEDYTVKEVAGKEVAFEIDLIEVKGKTLPELTDELVKKATNDEFTTLDAYKTSIKDKLTETYEKENENAVRTEVLKQASENVKVDLPQAMIDREVDQQLYYFENQLRQSGLDLEKYAQMSQKTKEDFKADFKPGAEQNLKTRLMLDKIVAEEKLTANDEDLEAEIQKWQLPDVKSLADLKAKPEFDLTQLTNSITQQKAEELIISKAKIS